MKETPSASKAPGEKPRTGTLPEHFGPVGRGEIGPKSVKPRFEMLEQTLGQA
jgi:hypothetical protein